MPLPARNPTQSEPGVPVLLCKKDSLDRGRSVERTQMDVSS